MSRWRGRLRATLCAAALAAACAAVLQVGYLLFVRTLLPDLLMARAMDAGVVLELGYLRSPHPGRIVLGELTLRGPRGWSLRADELDATARGYLPFGAPWQLDQCSVAGLSIVQQGATSIGPLRAAISAPFAAHPGRVEAAGSRVHARIAGWSAELALDLRARLAEWRGIDEFRLGEGTLALRAEQPDVRALLQLETISVSPDQPPTARGRLTSSGGDAGLWLDLARADDSIRWLLSELVGLPFELRAAVSLRDGWLHLQDLAFAAGPTLAHGELRSDGETLLGALLVRRGEFKLGLSLSDAGVRAELMPAPHWLAQQLGEHVD